MFYPRRPVYSAPVQHRLASKVVLAGLCLAICRLVYGVFGQLWVLCHLKNGFLRLVSFELLVCRNLSRDIRKEESFEAYYDCLKAVSFFLEFRLA
ncbi:hypothetical protein AtEden1_Chr2g0246171 [Arabidopsis thaliana]